jgi:hypothetical protein
MDIENNTHKHYPDWVKRPGEDDPVFFYPPEFGSLDNFSAFQVEYDGYLWATSEHAYQAAKFKNTAPEVVELIKNARSAHDAQKIAQEHKPSRIPNWEELKVEEMRKILRSKIQQHKYVLRKLLQTGDRKIIEDSWRDAEWGWGKNKDGQNLLGKLWMELREEFRASQT